MKVYQGSKMQTPSGGLVTRHKDEEMGDCVLEKPTPHVPRNMHRLELPLFYGPIRISFIYTAYRDYTFLVPSSTTSRPFLT